MRDRSGTALEICTATLNSLPSGLGSVQATPHFVPISETPRASPSLLLYLVALPTAKFSQDPLQCLV